MSFNVISDVGARALAALISRSDSLTTVTLVDNNIRAAGARALAHGLAAKSCILKSLDLRLNYIGDEGAVELYRVLTLRNRTLASINVSSNLCTMASSSALADMLRHNSVINRLDISSNNLAVCITRSVSVCLSVCLDARRNCLCMQWRSHGGHRGHLLQWRSQDFYVKGHKALPSPSTLPSLLAPP